MIRIGVIGAGPNGTGNAKKLAAHAERAKIVALTAAALHSAVTGRPQPFQP